MDDPDADIDDKVPTPAQSSANATSFCADIDRIIDSLPERRQAMIRREIRLRKIHACLVWMGYTQEQINKVFSEHCSEELFNELERKHDEVGLPTPDISDIHS
jgi:hypothetical protein